MGRALALLGVCCWVAGAGPASAGDDALAKMGRRVTQDAAKELKSKDPVKRREAAERLSGWASPEGAALLAQALSDDDYRVRATAARSLASYEKQAEPARAALQRALDDSFAQVAVQAAEALERALGVPEKDLVPVRSRVLGEAREPYERFLAARSLVGHAPPANLVGPLLDYLDEQARPSEDWKVRDARSHNLDLAKDALERLVKKTGDRALIGPLTEAVRRFRYRNDVPLRLLSLFDPRPEGWAALLVEQLDVREPGLLREALALLGRTARTAREVAQWAPEAARLERHPDQGVRDALVAALGEAGGLASDQVQVPLRALVLARDAGQRRRAAQALGEIGDRDQATPAAGKKAVAEAAAPELLRAIDNDAEVEVRAAAVEAYDRLQVEPASAVRQLAAFTAAAYPEPVRLAALRALRNRGPAAREAVATLKPLLDDPSQRVKDDARQALELIQRAADTPAPKGRPAAAPPAARPAAPRDAAAEARGLDVLRARGAKLDEHSFYRALGERDTELVQAFLDAGLSADQALESTGENPLRFMLRGACSPLQRPSAAETKATARLLLARGANVNATDGHGNTALMEAAMQGCDRELMGILIKAGAKVGLKNASGLSAFEMGLYSGHDGLEELVAAGYRLPADKVALYKQAYASNPKAVALVQKAAPAGK